MSEDLINKTRLRMEDWLERIKSGSSYTKRQSLFCVFKGNLERASKESLLDAAEVSAYLKRAEQLIGEPTLI